MFKSKLSEYCQKNKIPNPQFTCTGLPLAYSSSVLINIASELDASQTFQSRETHTTKKKAENDASEVAFNAIFDTKMLPSNLSVDPNTVAAENLQDLIESIIKVVFAFHRGIFSSQNLVPVEYILLFAGVQSALNRVNPTNRKNCLQAYSYLLKALSSPLQTVLALETEGSRHFVRKIIQNSQDITALDGTVGDSEVNNGNKLQQARMFQFVVIPASESTAPYEVHVDVSGDSECGVLYNSDAEIDHGSRILNCFTAMSSALQADGNLSISAPLYNPSAEKYHENLDQLFPIEKSEHNCAVDLKISSETVLEDLSSTIKKTHSQLLKPRLFMQYRNPNGVYYILLMYLLIHGCCALPLFSHQPIIQYLHHYHI